eukprot:6867937-Pyramimonas_sp.AAC.1
MQVTKRAKYSTPGVDGLPYAAWAAIDFGPQLVTLQAVLPKGPGASGTAGGACERYRDRVRVLGLRDTDTKILSSVVNVILKLVVDFVVPASQR